MGPGHSHAPSGLGRSFAIASGLNVLFIVVELVSGVLADSTALLADAAHNLTDVLGLALAWGASALSARHPTESHTYGLRKTTILAALANALLLLMTVGGVAWESIERLSSGRTVSADVVLYVALVGVAINGFSAALFAKGAKHDINLRGAFLHLLVDAAVSLSVVFVGLMLMFRPEWSWLDSAASLAISGVILLGTWQLLKDSLHLSMDGVPPGVDLMAIRGYLESVPEVLTLHDLHVWALSTSETALTVHLVVEPPTRVALVSEIEKALREHYAIRHTTIQVDSPSLAADCHTC